MSIKSNIKLNAQPKGKGRIPFVTGSSVVSAGPRDVKGGAKAAKIGAGKTKPGKSTISVIKPDTLTIQPVTPVLPVQPIQPVQPIKPMFPAFSFQTTATQLAQGTVGQLEKTSVPEVREAIRVIKPNTSAASLMSYLERKVRIGEVLNELAEDWDKETVNDFATAFRMDKEKPKLDVMDNIVSIAILNDPDLEDELRMENTPEVEEGDLLENRRIVWQYPPAGTPLEPPYIILAAVEHEDVARADEVVHSVLGELGEFDKFKVPRRVAEKLGRTRTR
jgi:hypothetical protein